MRYVRFGKYDSHGQFREALGTDSFHQPDGRLSHANAHQGAISLCQALGYDGFQWYQGTSILDAKATGYPADCRPYHSTKG